MGIFSHKCRLYAPPFFILQESNLTRPDVSKNPITATPELVQEALERYLENEQQGKKTIRAPIPSGRISEENEGHLEVAISPDTDRVHTTGDAPRLPFYQGGEVVPNPDRERDHGKKGKKVKEFMKKMGKVKTPNWWKDKFGKNKNNEGPGGTGGAAATV